ncbi:MAG: beta-ketoacyl synthase chain length factor [Gammaproteobacteria bacterium]|nr:beta-ketoacyl synthase chain length factor [Gammaproteobacteria bacterium]MDE2261843.1 beta-ketoacyl synthase chain length factor [Gammaproteobacteria bacterium]
MLSAYIQGIGLIGPGLSDWQSGARALAGEEAYSPRPTAVPAPEGLPAAERRRTGATVRLGLSVAQQAAAAAGLDPAALLAVFSSSAGDGVICHEICETLAGADRQVSPTRFHNSVHNAAAGYWSLATGATAASTALCAHDASFAAGLLEALAFVTVERVPVLLSAYETPYPQPLHAKRPLPDSFGVALVLTPAASPNARARLTASLCDAATAADRLSEPQLEALRQAVPAARSLPLLRLLARREPGEVVLDYSAQQRVAVGVEVEVEVEVRECP